MLSAFSHRTRLTRTSTGINRPIPTRGRPGSPTNKHSRNQAASSKRLPLIVVGLPKRRRKSGQCTNTFRPFYREHLPPLQQQRHRSLGVLLAMHHIFRTSFIHGRSIRLVLIDIDMKPSRRKELYPSRRHAHPFQSIQSLAHDSYKSRIRGSHDERSYNGRQLCNI
jgi:hypothetical protein